MSKERAIVKKHKYGAKVIDWISSKIIEDKLSIPELYRKYPKVCPPPETIRQWKYKYPYAKDKLNEAYLALFETVADELIELRKAEFPEGVTRDELLRLDKKYNHLKTVNTIILTKIAPTFSAQYRETKNIEHSGKVETGFNVILQDYANLPDPKDITPKDEDNK